MGRTASECILSGYLVSGSDYSHQLSRACAGCLDAEQRTVPHEKWKYNTNIRPHGRQINVAHERTAVCIYTHTCACIVRARWKLCKHLDYAAIALATQQHAIFLDNPQSRRQEFLQRNVGRNCAPLLLKRRLGSTTCCATRAQRTNYLLLLLLLAEPCPSRPRPRLRSRSLHKPSPPPYSHDANGDGGGG